MAGLKHGTPRILEVAHVSFWAQTQRLLYFLYHRYLERRNSECALAVFDGAEKAIDEAQPILF